MKVLFKAGDAQFIAQLNDTQTAKDIAARLPVASTVSTWGDEIYFDIGFKASAQGASMEVKEGDVAYWPQGKCLCIFFGPTPASTTEIPVPASPVVVIGTTQATQDDLRAIQLGEKISVELIKP